MALFIRVLRAMAWQFTYGSGHWVIDITFLKVSSKDFIMLLKFASSSRLLWVITLFSPNCISPFPFIDHLICIVRSDCVYMQYLYQARRDKQKNILAERK